MPDCTSFSFSFHWIRVPSLRYDIAFLALSLLLVAAVPGSALIYTYENTTSATVNETVAPCAGPLVRSFTVNDSFTVSNIAVGMNITHTYRGDLRFVLVAPDNTTLQFVTENGGDGDDNYDVLMSNNTEGALDDGDTDPTAEPFYSRIASVGSLGSFYTGNANGTWSLRICDAFGGDTGTFNRALLVLTSTETATASDSSTLTYDWGSNGNGTAFASTTVGATTLTQTSTTDFGGAGTTNGTFVNLVTDTDSISGHSGFYSLYMDVINTVGNVDSELIGEQTTFGFSPQVRDLTFTLNDADFLAGDFEDQIRVYGTDSGGNTIPYTITVGSTAQQIAGNLVEGDTAVPNDQTGATSTYVFSGPVASLRIDYLQGDQPAAGAGDQVIGLSDFVFTTFDYGDAPASYGTTLGTGARHVLGDRSLFLGSNPPDGESDGQAGAAATTDDTSTVGGVDDEDGVATFPSYTGSGSYTVTVDATNLSTTTAGNLVGYIDWNRDGDFADAGERSATVSVPANTTTATGFNVTWNSLPANASGTSATFARFRIAFTASEAESPTGQAASGEVEDYEIAANTLPVTLASFSSYRSGGQIEVRWGTDTETSTVGYGLLAEQGRQMVDLLDTLVPAKALDSLKPRSYQATVADEGQQVLYLEDWDTEGRPARWGPFEVGESYGRTNGELGLSSEKDSGSQHELTIDWAPIRAASEAAAKLSLEQAVGSRSEAKSRLNAESSLLAELVVSEAEGMYRLGYEDLASAGVRLSGVAANGLALFEAATGEELPIDLYAPSGTFGPGSHLVFRGRPLDDSIYSKERVYHLVGNHRGALRVETARAPGRGRPLRLHFHREEVEQDLIYSFASPNGDPWYAARLLAQGSPAERSFEIQVDELESSMGELHLGLWGVTDWPGEAPDHHLEVYLNDQLLTNERFDGLSILDLDLPLPEGLLVQGSNTLRLRLPGDTGFAFDLVNLDRYAITYPRHLVARDGRLSFSSPGNSLFVEGFSSPDVRLYADEGRVRLNGAGVRSTGNGWGARFSVPDALIGTQLDLTDASALHRPMVRQPRPLAEDLLIGPADYLVITHPLFIDALGPLVAARANDGMKVKVVDIADLYQAYSGGQVDPEAIRSYLREAQRALGLRYVLLVGGDSYDYLDNLGIGSVSFIPTLYTATDSLIRFTPSDSLLADLDGDGFQDLAIGRLPARTEVEAEMLVAKTLDFTNSPAAAVMAADASDTGAYTEISRDLERLLPRDWGVSRAYLDEDGAEGARTNLLAQFNQGARLVSYVGHSGPSQWTFQGLFSALDGSRLENRRKPAVVVQWGCWNTYHVAPETNTLSHQLLLASDRGAAAAVGSSTLTMETSDRVLGPILLGKALRPGARLGDAILQAKRQLGDLETYRDVILGWTLLGDPALVLNP